MNHPTVSEYYTADIITEYLDLKLYFLSTNTLRTHLESTKKVELNSLVPFVCYLLVRCNFRLENLQGSFGILEVWLRHEICFAFLSQFKRYPGKAVQKYRAALAYDLQKTPLYLLHDKYLWH